MRNLKVNVKFLQPPLLVAKASGTSVVIKENKKIPSQKLYSISFSNINNFKLYYFLKRFFHY